MTTKLRHPHVAPLRPINTKSNFLARTNSIVKRKTAVQMLQETKAFYVKSETVLDKKQEFRPGKASESPYKHFSQKEKTQKIIQKENRLQDKLRVLLDFDSADGSDVKRNAREVTVAEGESFDKTTCFQHKSLPDLHMSPCRSSSESSDSSFDLKCDGDSRSAYSSRTQPETRAFLPEKCRDCRRCIHSTKSFCSPEFQTHPRIYSSFRATKSGQFAGSKLVELESHRRRSSHTSSCNRSQHNSSSKHSQSADSGRQSQGGSIGLRTGRSGLPEFSSPPPNSIWTDSGTEDDSPPLLRSDVCEGEKKRPILRSKSDISYKFCGNKPKLLSSTPVLHPSLPTTEKLETFFDHLGMDPTDYRELASNNSRNSSPVFFSSVSSIDSCVDLTGWSVPEPYKNTECPSIVERNARIIKWLYNCRKFQKTVTQEGKALIFVRNHN